MLDLDLATIGFQIVNFLILAIGLYYLLFKPMLKNMKERADTKAQLMQELESEKQAVAELHIALEERLSSAEETAATILREARGKAETERATFLEQTQAEMEEILKEAHVDAIRLKKQAINEFYDELLDSVLDVSNQMIARISPPDAHNAMVQELLDSVWELGRNDMRQVEVLREGLGDRTPTVVATSARTLSTEQQGQIVRTYSALADRNIHLDLNVEPALGLGIRVRIGDLVMENTIANRLSELKEIVGHAPVEQFEDE